VSKQEINTMSPRSSADVSESPPDSSYAPDVEKAQAGAGASVDSGLKKPDTDIVDWDGPDDPENPQNW
jgi:hypothetical protein